jgi:hypothetical protein
LAGTSAGFGAGERAVVPLELHLLGQRLLAVRENQETHGGARYSIVHALRLTRYLGRRGAWSSTQKFPQHRCSVQSPRQSITSAGPEKLSSVPISWALSWNPGKTTVATCLPSSASDPSVFLLCACARLPEVEF